MKIQFIGATHEVTGSCTLLEVGGRYYMVDCGMEQGTDVFQNIPLPVPANAIEAVFLTHAHIDHSGMLPKLCKDGFSGPIYATEATCALCNIMLRDSAHIQESEAQWRSRKAERAGEPLVEPTYNMNDALAAIKLLRPVRYQELLQVAEGIDLRMTDIGHLLGSAAIELWLTEMGETRKIVFSGDVGNTNQPLLNDPKSIEETDYLVMESTYGDRLHDRARGDAVAELADCIQRAFDRGGNLVIPSFAVGRTQEMLYAIREIKQKGLVKGHDGFPVYVDSPLAVEATGIFLQCDISCLDEKTMALVQQGINPANKIGWELVTDASTLAVDDEVIIVAKNADKALAKPTSTVTSQSNFPIAEISKTGSVIYDIEDTNTQTFTLASGNSENSFAFVFNYKDTDYHMYAPSSGLKGRLASSGANDDTSWSIEISATDGDATIKNARPKVVKYNNATGAAFLSLSPTASNALKAEYSVCIYKKQVK